MKLTVASLLMLLGITTVAQAESCYDLWYERNAIYDAHGFCFKTQLGKETFDNSDCVTSIVQLTPAEQRRVDQIKAEEKRRNCRVNQ
jgi:hypothetical protein